MNYQELITQMTPDIYRRMVRAVEVGRWPDGRTLTAQQKESTMQAIIAWGELHLPPAERVGFIDKGKKGAKAAAGGEPAQVDQQAGVEPLNWKT